MKSNYLLYKLKNNLPNFFTLLNLLSGTLAIMFVFNEQYWTAFYLVLLGIFFDFIDGMVARLTRTSSELGLQLDSMADLVTSGMVPAFFLMKIWKNIFDQSLLYLFPLLIVLGSAWRLAKFNIDSKQKSHFIGLPTPSNALLLMSVGFIFLTEPESSIWHQVLSHPWAPVLITLLSVWLLNAGLPLISLKISSGNKKPNVHAIVLIIISALLISIMKFKAAPIILGIYILLSLHYFKIFKH